MMSEYMKLKGSLLFCIMAIQSCAQPEKAAGTISNLHRDRCWQRAAKEGSDNRLEVSIVDAAILRRGFVLLDTIVRNNSAKDLWINGRFSAFHTGIPAEQQIYARLPTMKRSGIQRINEGLPPKESDYFVLAAGKVRKVNVALDTVDRIVEPGTMRIGLCFVDENKTPPSAPVGSELFRGPATMWSTVNVRMKDQKETR